MSEAKRKFIDKQDPIGWEGMSLRGMLTESERLFQETGRWLNNRAEN